MDARDIREYANRDWKAVERSKRDYLAERAREDGGLWAFWASQSLFAHMLELHPGFPASVPREADLAHHVELKRLLDRTRDARAPR